MPPKEKPFRLYAALDPSALNNDEATRTIRNVVVSTGAKNRNGWAIKSTSIDLTNYRKNPILLWNHENDDWGHIDPDIVIGTCAVRVEGENLVADLTFEDGVTNPLAEKIYRKMLAKTIRATSIGFQRTESHLELNADGKLDFVIDAGELLEISVTIIPANPDSVQASITSAIASIHPEWGKEDSMNKVFAALMVALCLPETADEKTALGAVENLQASQKTLKDLTGKDNPAEAAGVVAAWKAGAEQAQASLAELAKLKQETAEAKRASLISDGMKAGKILPPQENWAKTLPIETLQAYLDNTPSLVPPTVTPPPTVAAGAHKPWAEMTTAEKHRLGNDDPETFAALQAAAQKG